MKPIINSIIHDKFFGANGSYLMCHHQLVITTMSILLAVFHVNLVNWFPQV